MRAFTVPYRMTEESKGNKGYSGKLRLEVEDVPWGRVFTLRECTDAPAIIEFCVNRGQLELLSGTQMPP